MDERLKQRLGKLCALKKAITRGERELAAFRRAVAGIDRCVERARLKDSAAQKLLELRGEILAAENELLEKNRHFCGERAEILRIIESIKVDEYREIFEMKYIEGRTWEQIAEVTNYSTRSLYTINKKVLENL